MFPTPKISPEKKIFLETIFFHGHRNILGTHQNTLEITREEEISKRADCIIGVRASKSCSDLDPGLAAHIKSGGKMDFEITVDELKFHFSGFGSRNLDLSDPVEIVFRRSEFLSPRTLAISCDAAAADLPRDFIGSLKNPETVGKLEIFAVETNEVSREVSLGIESLEIENDP